MTHWRDKLKSERQGQGTVNFMDNVPSIPTQLSQAEVQIYKYQILTATRDTKYVENSRLRLLPSVRIGRLSAVSIS